MSMNATESASSAAATLRATVDLPEPVPPAIPMMNGFIASFNAMRSSAFAALCLLIPALAISQGTNKDTVDIVIASTTDTHGWLRGWDYATNAPDTTRGLSRIATIVDSLRRANPDRVL